VLGLVVGAVAALAAARAAYPRFVERRAAQRRRIGADGVVPGAATITLERDGAPAVLVLHGAGDTTQVVAGLARHLHARGFAVRAPLLSGHGRALSDLREVSAQHWLDEAEREYEVLAAAHPTIAVVGLSMGGALAVGLAGRHRNLCALVLLAPYVNMSPWMRTVARSARAWGVLVPYFSSRGQQSIHDPEAAARALGYGVFTPAALHALAVVMQDARAMLPRVMAPTLVVQSEEDNRIPRAAATQAFNRLGASEKEMRWIRGAGHVITVDYGHEQVIAATANWLCTHCALHKNEGRGVAPTDAPPSLNR